MMVDTIPPITLTNWNVVHGRSQTIISLAVHWELIMQKSIYCEEVCLFKIPVTLCLFLSDNLDILHICKLAYLALLARHKLRSCTLMVNYSSATLWIFINSLLLQEDWWYISVHYKGRIWWNHADSKSATGGERLEVSSIYTYICL